MAKVYISLSSGIGISLLLLHACLQVLFTVDGSAFGALGKGQPQEWGWYFDLSLSSLWSYLGLS